MKLIVISLAVLAVLAVTAGCAHEPGYVYLPTGPAATGGPAARYLVPPAAPQAEVYVTSFGLTDLDVGPGQTARMVHARLAVSNSGPSAVVVDGRAQALVVPGLARQAPAFLNTDAAGGPLYQVAPATANVFDLYFTAPSPYADAHRVGLFTLDWRVDVAGVAVAERTSFERFANGSASYAAYPPYVTVGLGFGVGWWYGPRWVVGPRPPVVLGYYYGPGHVRGSAWRGPPAGAWRGAPPRGWQGAPAAPARRPPGGAWRRR